MTDGWISFWTIGLFLASPVRIPSSTWPRMNQFSEAKMGDGRRRIDTLEARSRVIDVESQTLPTVAG